MRIIWMTLIALTASILLSGCGDPKGGQGSFPESQSQALVPADAALAEIYARSCRNCHTIAATGSPLTGDVAAWAPRLDKGMGVMVDNVVNGFGGMPPFGLCMDCDAGQFEALIQFMATGE